MSISIRAQAARDAALIRAFITDLGVPNLSGHLEIEVLTGVLVAIKEKKQHQPRNLSADDKQKFEEAVKRFEGSVAKWMASSGYTKTNTDSSNQSGTANNNESAGSSWKTFAIGGAVGLAVGGAATAALIGDSTASVPSSNTVDNSLGPNIIGSGKTAVPNTTEPIGDPSPNGTQGDRNGPNATSLADKDDGGAVEDYQAAQRNAAAAEERVRELNEIVGNLTAKNAVLGAANVTAHEKLGRAVSARNTAVIERNTAVTERNTANNTLRHKQATISVLEEDLTATKANATELAKAAELLQDALARTNISKDAAEDLLSTVVDALQVAGLVNDDVHDTAAIPDALDKLIRTQGSSSQRLWHCMGGALKAEYDPVLTNLRNEGALPSFVRDFSKEQCKQIEAKLDTLIAGVTVASPDDAFRFKSVEVTPLGKFLNVTSDDEIGKTVAVKDVTQGTYLRPVGAEGVPEGTLTTMKALYDHLELAVTVNAATHLFKVDHSLILDLNANLDKQSANNFEDKAKDRFMAKLIDFRLRMLNIKFAGDPETLEKLFNSQDTKGSAVYGYSDLAVTPIDGLTDYRLVELATHVPVETDAPTPDTPDTRALVVTKLLLNNDPAAYTRGFAMLVESNRIEPGWVLSDLAGKLHPPVINAARTWVPLDKFMLDTLQGFEYLDSEAKRLLVQPECVRVLANPVGQLRTYVNSATPAIA